MSEKEIRNSIASDLWTEEQRATEAQRKLKSKLSWEYLYLSGVIRGLLRARDIVERQGTPPSATLEERKQLVDEMLNEKD